MTPPPPDDGGGPAATKRISWSQNGEDVRLWRVFDAFSHGHYVEVGAYEPDIDSISRSFYERGWDGLVVEPVAEIAERYAQERPRDTVVAVAAGSEHTESTFHVIQGTGLSTQSAHQAQEHLHRGLPHQERVIPVRPLADLVRESGLDPIHFMVIDVEGSEEAVLKGAALDRIRPWVVIVEATKPMESEATWQEWESIVLESGYLLAADDGLNRFYVAEERAELAEPLVTPPNPIDNFVQFGHKQTLDELQGLRHEVEALRDDLRMATDQLAGREETDTELQELRDSCERLRAESGALSEQLAVAHDALAGMSRSRSWRWTAPLRALRGHRS